MSSDTPRTDVAWGIGAKQGSMKVDWRTDFASQLERELAEAIRQRDEAIESERMMQDRLNRLVSKSRADQKAKCLKRKLGRIGKWL